MDLGSVENRTLGPAGQGSISARLFTAAGVKRARKLQAASLTAGPGYDRMNLERNNYGTF